MAYGRGKLNRRFAGIIDSPVALRGLAVVMVVLGVFFFLCVATDIPAARENAIPYSGEFLEYVSDDRVIVFADGTERVIRSVTVTPDFSAAMKQLRRGVELHLLIDPNTDCVVEVRTDTEELMNVDAARAALHRDNIAGVFAGLLFIGFAVFLRFFAKRTEKRQAQPPRLDPL